MRKRFTPTRNGFTLIELVIVMLILSTLAGMALPKVRDYQASARDARRMTDIKVVQEAIEQYFLEKGEYPPHNANSGFGNWDVSQDGDFIPALVNGGYLPSSIDDPSSHLTGFRYQYQRFSPGTGGCVGGLSFYVLGIKNFESEKARAEHVGGFKCVSRDWGTELAFTTGGGASYQ